MSFDIALNFRGTSGYVTDPAGTTFCLADAYPTTRGGATFGNEDSLGGLDRDSTVADSRLAGVMFSGSSGQRFRVDLPATGNYTVALALGDALSAQSLTWVWKDNTTTLGGKDGFMSAVKRYFDTTGTEYTDSTWLGGNTPVQYTFASTIFRLVTGTGFNATSVVAHLRIVQQVVAGGGPFPHYIRRAMAGGMAA